MSTKKGQIHTLGARLPLVYDTRSGISVMCPGIVDTRGDLSTSPTRRTQVRALHAGTMNGLRVESVVSSSFKASENIAVVIRR